MMERREAFKRWLQSERNKKSGRPIPEKTIDGYLRSIHKVSDMMYETGVISKRLYSMKDAEEVKEAVSVIKKDRNFLNMNTASENMCQKALNYYSTFIEAMAAKAEDE